MKRIKIIIAVITISRSIGYSTRKPRILEIFFEVVVADANKYLEEVTWSLPCVHSIMEWVVDGTTLRNHTNLLGFDITFHRQLR